MNRTFVTDINRIKFEVNTEVARLTYAGKLDEKSHEIPFKIIPGRTPHYRCCVYKEREIIRERVQLAMGRVTSQQGKSRNIVQVIEAACEGCPINRFNVTNNCQMCMAKKCLGACNFDAISFEGGHAVINHKKCKECGRCAQACPYNAIADLVRPCKRSCPVDAITMDEDNIVDINEEKCINCGQCVMNCPFGALSDRSFIVDVIRMIQSGLKVYAMVAPAIEGIFGPTVSVNMIKQALKDVGFTDVFEVSLGADFVSQHEGEELLEHFEEGIKMTTSCCPAFVSMIKKHFPQVLKNMSTTVSPMQATARLIKAMYPDAICVFIGPCIAKKAEIIESVTFDGADYAMTYEEMCSLFEAKNIDLESYADEGEQDGSRYGKNYAVSGGVTAAVVQYFKEANKEADLKTLKCNGAAECKKALMMLKIGRLPEDFVEGMCCEGGCVNGPGSLGKERTFMKTRNDMIAKADDRGVIENIARYEDLKIDMTRS